MKIKAEKMNKTGKDTIKNSISSMSAQLKAVIIIKISHFKAEQLHKKLILIKEFFSVRHQNPGVHTFFSGVRSFANILPFCHGNFILVL